MYKSADKIQGGGRILGRCVSLCVCESRACLHCVGTQQSLESSIHKPTTLLNIAVLWNRNDLMIYCVSGSGSSSYFGKVLVPVPVSVPDPDPDLFSIVFEYL